MLVTIIKKSESIMRHLAQPLILKHHTLKNRIIMGSMHTGWEEHPEGAKHLATFYAERAKYGVALIITGGISPNADGVIIEHGTKLTTSEECDWHRPIPKAVHKHHGKICLQILHAGRYSKSQTPVAPSAIATPLNPVIPRALTIDEIQHTIQDYIHCAQLAQQAGYDGVEIMGSEGYLINQFLAPATNQRSDCYGGTLENRQRFAQAIVRGIRQACGEQFLLLYRISLLDLVENGSTWEETATLATTLIDVGVDLFNTGIGWHESRVPTIATTVPRAAFAQFTGKLKAISTIPVFASNRINTPEIAEHIVNQKWADGVCLARPFLADPQWASKALHAKDEHINTCIACNQACLDHIFIGKLTSCLVNPFACHELSLNMTPASPTKRIAVVGAGPAGLAFATTAAKRGHHVTLFEQHNEIGGQLNIAKTIPGKPEFYETLRYYQHTLNNATNLTVKLGHKVTADMLRHYDEIILATGIIPRTIQLKGIENNPNVLTYLEVLRDHKPIAERIAIIGAGGIGFDVAETLSHQGIDNALHPTLFHQEWNIDTSLQNRGALSAAKPNFPPSPRQIWLLQRKPGTPGRQLGKTTGWIHQLTLRARGVQLIGGVEYLQFDEQGLHIRHEQETRIIPAQQLIICAGQEPNRQLADACIAQGLKPHLIGGADITTELDAKRAIKTGTMLALQL